MKLTRKQFLLAAAGAPLLLRTPTELLPRPAGGTPLALITADSETHVAALDLTTGRILKRIATPEGPRSIESWRATTAVVCHTTEGAVSLLEADSLTVRGVLRSFAAPRYAAAHPTEGYAYVTDSHNQELVTLDLRAARVIHRLQLGGPARHVTIHPDGQQLWAALGSKAESIAVISLTNPSRPRQIATLRPPFLAHDVGFQPNGERVWVTSGDQYETAIYDAASRRILLRVYADAPPQHVTFKPGAAYVTSGDDGTLRIHDLANGRRLHTTPIPSGSYNIANGWQRVFTPSLQDGTLTILDKRGAIKHQTHVARNAHDTCFVVGT